MRAHTATLPLLAALMFGCGRPSEDRPVAHRDTKADSVIYSVLLDTLRGTGDSVFVMREFEEFPGSVADAPAIAGWAHKQQASVDSSLVVALAGSRYAGSLPAILGSPRGVWWFTRPSELGKPIPFPKYRVVSFSRIVFDPARTRALVYASMGCGGLCGNGSFYAFGWHDGAWIKVGQVVRSIS